MCVLVCRSGELPWCRSLWITECIARTTVTCLGLLSFHLMPCQLHCACSCSFTRVREHRRLR